MGDLHLAQKIDGLRNDEVDARLGRPGALLVEHRPHPGRRRLVARFKEIGVTDVARNQRGLARGLPGDRLGDLERLAVERLEQVFLADQPELLAVAVIGERLDDVGARVDEIAVRLGNDLRMLEHDLGHEGPGLQVAPALELEEVALGADHRAGFEPLHQPSGSCRTG